MTGERECGETCLVRGVWGRHDWRGAWGEP